MIALAIPHGQRLPETNLKKNPSNLVLRLTARPASRAVFHVDRIEEPFGAVEPTDRIEQRAKARESASAGERGEERSHLESRD